MMDPSQQKEQWSQVYVRAIATIAGYSVYQPEVDDESVDMGLAGRRVGDVSCPPRIELQLKGTEEGRSPSGHAEHVVYRLKRKNYDDLRYTAAQLIVPRLLVVVVVPRTLSEWHLQTEAGLTLRRCAYWVSLAGLAESTVRGDKVTVRLPKANLFSVEGLRDLMGRAGRKEPL